MARFQLLTAHNMPKTPGAMAEYLPAGTVVETDQPSMSMRAIDNEGEDARLRADLAAGRKTPIRTDWRALPPLERIRLAIDETRMPSRAMKGGLAAGPRITSTTEADAALEHEIARRARLLENVP